ncbi:MAG TPA: hypothetical protein PKO09_15220 [Anaerolineae bacterium]|nr:hypothetical protein [Anaerolineae bacterium]
MRREAGMIAVTLLVLCLVSCSGMTSSGGSVKAGHSGSSGMLEVSHAKANGTTQRDIAEDDAGLDDIVSPGDVLEVDLTLAVGKGSFKIELLGQDGQVTLTLEARDGETLTGHGQIVVDNFGAVPYRVTAVEAENVDYYMEYWLQ